MIFFLTRFKISGHSMEPTLYAGNTVLVSALPYFFRNPKKDDIIVFFDKNMKKYLMKRITEIKNNMYMVAGDNKKDSFDSKKNGGLSKQEILGKVILQL